MKQRQLSDIMSAEDIKKAVVYLNRYLEMHEAENNK